MSERLDRLRRLPPETFAALLEELIACRFDEADVEASPPSPADAVDVIARIDGANRLYHARQYRADEAVGAPTVRELVAVRDRRGAQDVTLLTTGTVAPEARSAAREADVTVVAGEDVATAIEESDVSLPTAGADGQTSAAELAERFASYWPEQLQVRADAIVDGIQQFDDFEHRVRRADANTELEFRAVDSGQPLVKVRFTETSLLVFVWDGERFDRVVALTVHRERPPTTDRLLANIETALEAVDDERRS